MKSVQRRLSFQATCLRCTATFSYEWADIDDLLLQSTDGVLYAGSAVTCPVCKGLIEHVTPEEPEEVVAEQPSPDEPLAD